ncbi:MAG: outer membrane protein [Gammaproteobacteria bacterium]
MKRIFAASAILFLSGSSLAAASISSSTMQPKGFYLGGGVGDTFNKISGSSYLDTGAGWPDDHYANQSISDEFYGFLVAGYTWQRSENWLPSYSVGLRYMYVPSAEISGYVDQYSLPDFRNYNYSYDVQLLNILAILKVDLYRWQHFMPYVLVGAGVTTFTTTDYSEQALDDVTPRVSPGFGDGSGNNFAYQAGIGIDYEVNQNLVLNLEYDYINYGWVNTGKGANYSTLTDTNYDNESIKSKLSATTLFLGMTYYIG